MTFIGEIKDGEEKLSPVRNANSVLVQMDFKTKHKYICNNDGRKPIT